jgi:magnesium-transporting ATPase (P-type)
VTDGRAPRPTTALPSAQGLTTAEAARRLEIDGPNVLPARHTVPVWHRLVAQLTHFFAILLWTAAVLAVIGGLPQLGAAIAVVVVVNGLFAFAQEYRAERAAEALQDLLPRAVTVIRDGVTTSIDADELVVGDLVVLDAGDRVSADLELIEAHALEIDTSTLTGESVPARTDTGELVAAGTFVLEGEARAVVTAIGADTRLAGIASLARSRRRPPSPLARQLSRLVRTIALIAVGVGGTFFTLALALGTDATDGFLFAVGVTVALVPEGLLPTVTLSLAMGAQRMAHRHALVRRLESVETLGSTTFICTDKTGTLTLNQMTVVEVWTPFGSVTIDGRGYGPDADVGGAPMAVAAAARAARVGRLASSGRAVHEDGVWLARGDPMEAAVDALARRLGSEDTEPSIVARFPFDPRRRRMSIATAEEVLAKGAPEAIIDRCTLDATLTTRLHAELDRLTSRGLRLLDVASHPTPVPFPVDADGAERDLTLLAVLALEDPPRPAAHAALEACRGAGIKVAMVTGDHPATARAIAEETGLWQPGARLLDGQELPDDDEVLGALLDRDGTVVARVSPEDKLRIARALQGRGHVVAMTGDGVNDGPALQQADIGLAMGASGTDVAREAADLVLLDDDFATIVAAVAQGRATYTNVRRFLTYHLTVNVAELTPFLVWALSAGRVPLALGVLQIMCLDIVTDLLPALGLGAEPPAPHILEHPMRAGRLLDRQAAVRVFGVLGPTEAFIAMATFFATFALLGWRAGEAMPVELRPEASGAAFAAVVVAQAANVFACRSSRRFAWRVPLAQNPLILPAVAVQLVLLMLFLFVGPLATLLEQAPPPLAAWPVVLAAAPMLLAVDSLHKWLLGRHAGRPPAAALSAILGPLAERP